MNVLRNVGTGLAKSALGLSLLLGSGYLANACGEDDSRPATAQETRLCQKICADSECSNGEMHNVNYGPGCIDDCVDWFHGVDVSLKKLACLEETLEECLDDYGCSYMQACLF